MIEIQSENEDESEEYDEGLNQLLSFGRKVAIFWDYDDKEDYAKKLACRINNIKKEIESKRNGPLSLLFGCTGRIMTSHGDGKLNLATNELPITIENIMSKESAEIALQKAFPRTDKKKLMRLVQRIASNKPLPNKDFKKKKDLGMAFLALINERLADCKAKDVMKYAIAKERYETIKTFFDKLYKNIV